MRLMKSIKCAKESCQVKKTRQEDWKTCLSENATPEKLCWGEIPHPFTRVRLTQQHILALRFLCDFHNEWNTKQVYSPDDQCCCVPRSKALFFTKVNLPHNWFFSVGITQIPNIHIGGQNGFVYINSPFLNFLDNFILCSRLAKQSYFQI